MTISIDIGLKEELLKQGNASELISDLLLKHFKYHNPQLASDVKEREEKILKEAKIEMAEIERMDKITAFLKENQDRKEYISGVNKGKWRGPIEYAENKLGL